MMNNVAAAFEHQIAPITTLTLLTPEQQRFDYRNAIPAEELEPIFAQPANDSDIVRFGVEFAWSALHRDARGDLFVRLHFLDSSILRRAQNESLSNRLCGVRLFQGAITPDGVVRSRNNLNHPFALQMLFDIGDLCCVAKEMASQSVFHVESGELPDMDAGDYEEYKQWHRILTFIDDLPLMQMEQFDTAWTSWSHMKFWADKLNSSHLRFWSEAMMVRFEPRKEKKLI